MDDSDELDADLMVLGSRRPGSLQVLLVGSVAQAVIAHTRRTVLLAATDARISARRVTHRQAEPVPRGEPGVAPR